MFSHQKEDKFACTIAVLFLLDYPIRFYQFVIIVLYWRVHLYYDGKAIANFKLFQIFWVHTCTWGELENLKQLESALLSSSINPLFSFTGVYNYFYDVKIKVHSNFIKLPKMCINFRTGHPLEVWLENFHVRWANNFRKKKTFFCLKWESFEKIKWRHEFLHKNFDFFRLEAQLTVWFLLFK